MCRPRTPHQPIYERLKEIRFLEKLQEFLSPVRLPRTLLVKLEGCDGDANAFYEEDAINRLLRIYRRALEDHARPDDSGWRHADRRRGGPLFDTCLHEFGHALFDMLRVPSFGREEDVADQLSAYIMLHLGKAEARRLISGTAYAYQDRGRGRRAAHPEAIRRRARHARATLLQSIVHRLWCRCGTVWRLGGEGTLAKDRAEDCKDEYQQVAYAYEKLIGPHIDPRLAKTALDKNWLPDAKWRVPRRPGSAQTK